MEFKVLRHWTIEVWNGVLQGKFSSKTPLKLEAEAMLAVSGSVSLDDGLYVYILLVDLEGNDKRVSVLYPQPGQEQKLPDGKRLRIPETGTLKVPQTGLLRILSATQRLSADEIRRAAYPGDSDSGRDEPRSSQNQTGQPPEKPGANAPV